MPFNRMFHGGFSQSSLWINGEKIPQYSIAVLPANYSTMPLKGAVGMAHKF
ncbi:hypothetical protein BH10BAC4_BH10BAC4_17760 [soil metagenome]